MDIIKKAQARLAALDSERNKLLMFLATAQELGAVMTEAVAIGDHAAAEVVKTPHKLTRSRKPPSSGAIYETAMAIIEHMQAQGEGVKTRDLLPVVQRAGIEVGGQNPIATLSARIGSSQMFERRGGKLFIRNSPDVETADSHTNDTSAASFDL